MTLPSTRQIEMIDVDLIEVGERQRPVRTEAVDSLAASIEKIGLRTPISLRYYADRPAFLGEGETDDALILLTGAHRLAAVKKLGWNKIECFVAYEGDEIDAQLWEIAENLHRAELTTLERDEQVALWVKLNADKLSQLGTVSGGRGNTGGVRAASRELGIGKNDAHRAIKVAGLSDEAKQAARETGLDDNRSALLDAAKGKTPGEQIMAIRARAERRADHPIPDGVAVERQIASLMSAWNKAGVEARREFLARIDGPVFDKSDAGRAA